MQTWRDKLESIAQTYANLQGELAAGELSVPALVEKNKALATLEPLARVINQYRQLDQEQAQALGLVREADPELRQLAEQEVAALSSQLEQLENTIKTLLLPRDEVDSRDVILEIRTAAGGDEAALFAMDLFRMYQRYCDIKKWRTQILALSETEIGGCRDLQLSVKGEGVYGRLKFESGVHRVQRIPETESGGRIHTSTATVAILPEATSIDVSIDEKDLRIDTFRAQGAGGQHVNTTDSAVRVSHLPSGIIVQCQDEKSQHKNREKAMRVLQARLFDKKRREQDLERSAARRSQIGTGDRSERIRTYNFPQSRVTDHRINLTLHELDKVMQGGLDVLLDSLAAEAQARLLLEETTETGETMKPGKPGKPGKSGKPTEAGKVRENEDKRPPPPQNRRTKK